MVTIQCIAYISELMSLYYSSRLIGLSMVVVMACLRAWAVRLPGGTHSNF